MKIIERVLELAVERPEAVALRLWPQAAGPGPKTQSPLGRVTHAKDNRAESSDNLGVVSRAELVRRAASVAAAVGEKDNGDGPIGVCFCGTTPGAVAALLATRMLERTYLPLDASAQSPERAVRLCAAAGCGCVLLDGGSDAIEEALRGADVSTVNVERVKKIAADEAKSLQRRCIERRCNVPSLYLMYTSGSTGAPKGVVGTEVGALSRCDWQAATFPWMSTDVAIARTSLGFVDHVAEIFAPLLAGVPLVVQANASGKSPWREPAVLLETIRGYGVSRLVLVPSLLRELLRLGPLHETAPDLRYLHCSGEPLQVALAEQALVGASEEMQLLNLYGSTECAGDVTCQVITRHTKFPAHGTSTIVPVGSNLSRCQILLLVEAKDGNWVETDDIGDVFVSGAHLADGYYRDAKATAEMFLLFQQVGEGKWMVVSKEGTRFLRTGDKGVWVGGNRQTLHLLGRDDQQVKIRGVRVNLMEVEEALRTIERVKDAVVCQVAGSILALVLMKAEYTLCHGACSSTVMRCKSSERQLIQECSATLLAAAIPAQIYIVAGGHDLPRLQNGKTDRRSVQSVLSSLFAPSSSTDIPPLGNYFADNPTSVPDRLQQWTQYFQAVFAQQLGVNHITEDDNFFLRGGDSLKTVRLLSEVSKVARHQGLWAVSAPPLLAPFEANPTPRALANVILFGPTTQAATPPFEIIPLVESNVNEVALLVSREFCHREPLMASLGLSRSQQSAFEQEMRRFIRNCARSQVKRPLSFIAKSEGKILAFSINCEVEHYRPGESPGDRIVQAVGVGCARQLFRAFDCLHATARCFSCSASMPDEYRQHNSLYHGLFQSWVDWSRREFRANQCLHMVYSGADASFASGAAALRACDAAALKSATALGFEVAYTVCTSRVTHFIASEELHFKKRLQWAENWCAEAIASSLPLDCHIILYDKILQQPDALKEVSTIIRCASELAVPEGSEQYAKLQACFKASFNRVAPATLLREMRHLRKATNEAIILVDGEDKVIGGATFIIMHDLPTAAELMLIATRPDASGRGFGSRLLKEVEQECAKRELYQVFLVTKLPARGFYERHGFRLPKMEEQCAYDKHRENDQLESEVIHNWVYDVVTLVKDI